MIDLGLDIQNHMASLLDFNFKTGESLTEASDLNSRLFEKDFEGRSLIWYINETKPEELLAKSTVLS